MKKIAIALMAASVSCGFAETTATATDGGTTVTATAVQAPAVAGATAGATATVNVQVQVPLPPPPPPPPPPEPVFEKFRVCVMDFTTIDTDGQIRFLSGTNKKIAVPPQCTLNDADRKSVNSVMQGFVRIIDAVDNARTDEANRDAQVDDNVFRRKKALDIWEKTVNGQARPMVIGAEYMEAYLGRHSDVFACIDRDLMAAAMSKLRKDPGFPEGFQLKLARASGATHLVYGTVGDLATRRKSFDGYGIHTDSTTYSLDVIVKMVDLVTGQTAHAGTFTGTYREDRPAPGAEIDNNIFLALMKSALEQAAEELYGMCAPGRNNKIRVTPLPETAPAAEQAEPAQQAK